MNRHPESTTRIPENLEHLRARLTTSQIKSWFTYIKDFLRSEHQIDSKEFLSESNGSRIFNLDESGFPLAGTDGKLKIVTTMGVINVYKLSADTKEQITVLGCASAAGHFAKPYVIFPGVHFDSIWRG